MLMSLGREHVSQNGEIKIETYVERLFGYAMSLCRNTHEAEDLVQDSAAKALAARRVPTDEPAYRAWLFRILRNTFLDNRRRQQTASSALESAAAEPAMEFWEGDERLINNLAVKCELAKLPQAHSEILTLIDVVGLSYAEAAGLLGVPAGTVMSRVSRARRALLEALK